MKQITLEWHLAKNRLHRWELALLIGLACTLLWGLRLDSEQQALADQVIRLHVIANSDSEADQALKLLVRDRILAETADTIDSGTEENQVQQQLTAQLSQLAQAGAEVVVQEGYDYSVTVSLEENVWFPTKSYEDFSLPAGQYTALRIVIGEGEGENWWCVVFPSLSFSTVTEEVSQDSASLSPEQVALLTGETQGYVVKFKALELWDGIKSCFGS